MKERKKEKKKRKKEMLYKAWGETVNKKVGVCKKAEEGCNAERIAAGEFFLSPSSPIQAYSC